MLGVPEHLDQIGMRLPEETSAIERADLAIRPIDAHQPLDQNQLVECRKNGSLTSFWRGMASGDGDFASQRKRLPRNDWPMTVVTSRSASSGPIAAAGQTNCASRRKKQESPAANRFHGFPPFPV